MRIIFLSQVTFRLLSEDVPFAIHDNIMVVNEVLQAAEHAKYEVQIMASDEEGLNATETFSIKVSLQQCKYFLKSGGCLRVTVSSSQSTAGLVLFI